MKNLWQIFNVSLRLGLTSFGGPTAHIGFFKREYVDEKQWLTEKSYTDIVALCQLLPGPASSQVGMAIGLLRGGFLGSIVSWIGFTLPSVFVLVFFAELFETYDVGTATWIHSLKIVAVAVVLHAVLGMGSKLRSNGFRMSLALASAIILLIYPSTISQIGVIVGSALLGYLFIRTDKIEPSDQLKVRISKKQGMIALLILLSLLVLLPLLNYLTRSPHIEWFDIFFRIGSIVFGGGHVVLPLMEQALVPIEFVTESEFLAGYGLAQAVPGPLFTFASYLGMIGGGFSGAVIATIAIFLPSFLLVIGSLPFLSDWQKHETFHRMLGGVNACVVGILLAALYTPVFTSAIFTPIDFALMIFLFALLQFWKRPAWLIVIFGLLTGEILALFT